MKKILVTSALPYVNNIPHMGNIIGCVLSADVFARYHRSKGNKVLYVCGTDEHGTATETKAIEEGVTPREICDKYYAIHKEVYEWFDISFDVFGRTSEENHHRIVQDIFEQVKANGYVEEREVEQLYDPIEKRFLADRFVEGTCPHCKYERARGDQCENCGKLLDPTDLIDPKSKTSGATPILKKSTHLFLALDALQPKLAAWIEGAEKEGYWTQNAITTTRAWLDRGLEPRAITRDLSWGVPVPGMEGKVFYVWFDAPIGYISITDQRKDIDYKEWWCADDVQLHQFMAKDNIPFHTILFPATQLATGHKWTMLYHIDSTEYLQSEDGKFSKSRGTGLFGDDAMRTGLPADVYRYYLLINRPEKADTTFAWKDLQEKLNNELLANLGNLINRTLQFIQRFHESMVHEAVLEESDKNFVEWVQEQAVMVGDHLEHAREKDALRLIMTISQKGNAYFQEQQPWKTRESDPQACKRAMFVLANLCKDLAIMLEPFLPQTSGRIFEQLGIDCRAWETIGDFSLVGKIGEPAPLFERLDDARLTQIRSDLLAKQEAKTLGPVQIKAGRIVDVFRHPDADKLFCEQVDFGGQIRNIVSGLVGHYRQEDLRGKTALFVTNLKSAVLRGKESQGMILAAQEGEKVEVLFTDAEPGTLILGNGSEREITIDEFAKHTLEVKGKQLLVDSKPISLGDKPVGTKEIAEGKVR